MYKASVPVFVQYLTSMSAVLDKAQAFADAKKLDQAVLLGLRVYPDMFPFSRQIAAVTDHATRATGRLAGVEPPTFEGNETTIAALKARVEKALAVVKGNGPEQIDGSEEKEIVFKTPRGDLKFTGQQFLITFSLPNFYFHATTAYNILRGIGVEIGKRDFMGTPPQN
jgi:hypothetical protein